MRTSSLAPGRVHHTGPLTLVQTAEGETVRQPGALVHSTGDGSGPQLAAASTLLRPRPHAL